MISAHSTELDDAVEHRLQIITKDYLHISNFGVT
jgi:hypothetical protein